MQLRDQKMPQVSQLIKVLKPSKLCIEQDGVEVTPSMQEACSNYLVETFSSPLQTPSEYGNLLFTAPLYCYVAKNALHD